MESSERMMADRDMPRRSHYPEFVPTQVVSGGYGGQPLLACSLDHCGTYRLNDYPIACWMLQNEGCGRKGSRCRKAVAQSKTCRNYVRRTT